MNRLYCIFFLSFLLAGCEKPQPVATGPTPAPAPEVQEQQKPEPVAAEAGDTGMEILLQRGIEVPFDHEVNYDIKDVSKNGTPRRRVLIEILAPDFPQAVSSFTGVLETGGYVVASDEGVPGKQQKTYVKEGAPTYYLLIQDVANGPRLNNPEAVGSIHVMWNDK